MRALAALLTLTALAACAPESVEVVVLTPETPELAALLHAADQRWEAAGVAPERIQIGPGGAPVRLVPERAPVAVTRTRGQGSAYRGVRWMELYSLDVDVATHEVGHALGIDAVGFVRHSLDERDGCTAATMRPIMCSHSAPGVDVITSADLELACAAGDCAHFSPEL